MAITVFERQALKEFAEKYKLGVQNAIKKKKVARRRTLLPTRFSATVNTTGKLAKSIKYRIGSNGSLRFSSEDYLYWLIYGRRPNSGPAPKRTKGGSGGKSEFITGIEEWMRAKGITGVSPFAIANSIAKNGSSIYRNYRGKQSNLLNDLPTDKWLNELYQKMGAGYVASIEFSILDNLDTDQLNIEL